MNGFKLFNMMYVKLMKIKKLCVDQRRDQQKKTDSHHEEKELRFRKKTRCYRKENFKQNHVIKSKISIKKKLLLYIEKIEEKLTFKQLTLLPL